VNPARMIRGENVTRFPSPLSRLSRLLDLREGEARVALQAFATLFLVIAGHTTLETTRDAIFLSKLPASQLNVVYVALAGVTLLTSAASAVLTGRFGRKNTLIVSLVVAAYATMVFYFLPTTPAMAIALYVFSGLVGAMLTPQFWLLAAQLFTVSQGRRLFGAIASGGGLGAVAGAGSSALALRTMTVTALMPLVATLFVLAALLLTTVRVEPIAPIVVDPTELPRPMPRGAFFRHPYLVYIAGLVALSTAAVLTVDYLFKSTAARYVAPGALGEFFARYYAAMNAASLVVQVLIAGRLIRRLGVVGAVAVTPVLLCGGGVAALLGGGMFAVVLCLKGVDGSLRYSLHRVATELLYLPLPAEVRDRGKGFIDSGLSRAVQAATAILLYVLAVRGLATARVLSLLVVTLCAGWLGLALGLRRAYLSLFRHALAAGRIGPDTDLQELDFPSAEALVETMASPDPAVVSAAMQVLDGHGRNKLIPVLVLYHDSESVVVSALELFASSTRTDFIPLAVKLLGHASEKVRIAAVRALAKRGRIDALEKATSDASSLVRAYASFYLALREAPTDLMQHPLIAEIMGLTGDLGREGRKGLLSAIADAPDERAASTLVALAALPELDNDEEAAEQIAGAMATLKSPQFIPIAIAWHAKRVGREAFRATLVAVGEPALDACLGALADERGERRIRLQLPETIARFGSQRAADFLVDRLDRERVGLVRYRTLRALGRLVAANDVKTDRLRIEAGVRRNLEEYLRLLSLRAALVGERAPSVPTTEEAAEVLVGLVGDKLGQALERAFRLLKVAHKREDIHRVHTAALSSDGRDRANAGEFLDTLLGRRDQEPLRELLRIVVDGDSDVRRVELAAARGETVAKTRTQALVMLVDDSDVTLAALAATYAMRSGGSDLREVVLRAGARRPSILSMSEHLFGHGAPVPAGAANG
jgi:ATP:ADP antiporter, AAA family